MRAVTSEEMRRIDSQSRKLFGIPEGILHKLKIPISTILSSQTWHHWIDKRKNIRVIIDALLGTGLHGFVREPCRSVIVRATGTVTCGFLKIGLLKGQGPGYAGRIQIADISLPKVLRCHPR